MKFSQHALSYLNHDVGLFSSGKSDLLTYTKKNNAWEKKKNIAFKVVSRNDNSNTPPQGPLIQIKNIAFGLPWWRSGWESACQCRGHGFEPWSGRISHAAERLGPWAAAAEPARLEPVLRNERGRDGERPAHRGEEGPPLAAAGGSSRTEAKTQHSQKNKINK